MKAKISDAHTIAVMAAKIWKSSTVDELENDFNSIIASKDASCFVEYVDNEAIAFAQCGIRHDYVEGTKTSPVGFLEGIYVEEEYRHCGIAKSLLKECETWAKEMGCKEFASDCGIENNQSLKFHLAVGFEEANRIICFKKKI